MDPINTRHDLAKVVERQRALESTREWHCKLARFRDKNGTPFNIAKPTLLLLMCRFTAEHLLGIAGDIGLAQSFNISSRQRR